MKFLASSCWLDVKWVWCRLVIHNFHKLFPLCLLALLKSWEISLENYVSIHSLYSLFWSVSNLVHEFYSNFCDISLAVPCVQNTINFCIFTRAIGIFLEITLNPWNSLVTAAAWFDMGLNGLFFILNGLSFSDNDFLFCLDDSEPWIEASDENLHFVFYSSLSFFVFWFVLNLL